MPCASGVAGRRDSSAAASKRLSSQRRRVLRPVPWHHGVQGGRSAQLKLHPPHRGHSPGNRRGGGESPYHGIASDPFLHSTELCGTYHNEKNPYGVWVESTQLEWKESAYVQAGIACQDYHMHMPPAAGNSAPEAGGRDLPDVRQHLFQGAHDTGMLRGAVTVRICPNVLEAKPGDTVVMTASVVNSNAGHMIPSGCAEERVVWLHVEVTDAA